jgi:hypothetical protein
LCVVYVLQLNSKLVGSLLNNHLISKISLQQIKYLKICFKKRFFWEIFFFPAYLKKQKICNLCKYYSITVRQGFLVMWRHLICSELVGYKSYPPSTGLARQVQCSYGDSIYRLKSGCWCTHRLRGAWNSARPLCCSVQWRLMAHRLCPVTWLEQAGYVVHNVVMGLRGTCSKQGFFKGFCDVAKVATIQKLI